MNASMLILAPGGNVNDTVVMRIALQRTKRAEVTKGMTFVKCISWTNPFSLFYIFVLQFQITI